MNDALANNMFSDDADVPMDEAEARAVTESIRQARGIEFAGLLAIYTRKGWKAMGYPSFEDYGQKEFDLPKREAYRAIEVEQVRLNLGQFVTNQIVPNQKMPDIDKIPASHLRAVASLPPEQQGQAIQSAYETPVTVPVKRKDGSFGQRETVTEKHVVAVVQAKQAGNPTPTPEPRSLPAPQPRQEARRESLPSGVLSFSNLSFDDDWNFCFQMRQGSSYRVCFIPGELMVPALRAAGVEFGDDELPGQPAGDAPDREEVLDKFFGEATAE